MAKTVNEAMTAIADSIRKNAEYVVGVHISGKLSLSDMPNAINQTCEGKYNAGAIHTRDEDNGKVLRLANRLVDGEYERVVDIDSIVNTAISDFDSVKKSIKNYQVDVPSGTPTSEYGYLVKEACEKAANDASVESYNMGVNAGREEVYEEIQQPLDSAIEKIQQYAYGGEGEPGGSALSKITYVDNNIPNVYNIGVDNGKVDAWEECDKVISEINSNLENTVNIVNGYIDSSENPPTPWEKIEYLDENIPKVYEAGLEDGKSGSVTDDYLNTFWDEFQLKGDRKSYRYAFYDNYPDEIFKPKYPFKCTGNCSSMFQYAKMTKIEQTIDFSENTMTSVGSVFANTQSLETISDLRIKSGLSIVNWFTNAIALKNITITGVIDLDANFQYSPLTAPSIENIIGCLSSTVSGKTLTLKKSAVDNAFQTDDSEANGSTSQEWLELIATKQNWTISLA